MQEPIRTLDEAKDFNCSTNSFVLFEASDLATEVTPEAKRQKTALVKMKLKELSEDLQQRKESSLF